jgi:predicted Holliday junction resolvase-like endonuclease
MSKNRRYIFTFVFTLIVFAFLWMFNSRNNEISHLKEELNSKDSEIEQLQMEYDACKGEIYHKSKLLEMEKSKVNQLISKKDSLEAG